jgi:hypothetical protein
MLDHIPSHQCSPFPAENAGRSRGAFHNRQANDNTNIIRLGEDLVVAREGALISVFSTLDLVLHRHPATYGRMRGGNLSLGFEFQEEQEQGLRWAGSTLGWNAENGDRGVRRPTTPPCCRTGRRDDRLIEVIDTVLALINDSEDSLFFDDEANADHSTSTRIDPQQ